ncbi:hypothetical protein COEREDRAFT_79620 [Coemansia reversa NRRL 1564]|uniref:Uncharacterized protein n=1 Tax=Coemansia reversa (strain ATCC 12441 / NRRL 1564) TaxID=763665 RepID=A0A2G5BHW0_COERN|nr:hypothetical protein COEREDRAFT_79620 [Coemansia reversa NRRL 1564]|eukprot:PIA18585.1 hypothetical protein COEREDRAFT_79620 [Coemansia reversa NRRL 1564]
MPADISGNNINAVNSESILESTSGGTEMVDGPGNSAEPIPQSNSKCTVGCGVGIGVGCLAGIILIVFVFIMTRRHKRKLQTIWQHRRWLATQKELPDKPIPAPPPPTKN